MKKLLLALLILGTSSAYAQYPGHNHRGGWGYGWVGPTIIGGVVGYEIARNQQPVIVQQPSVVYVQPQPVVQAPPPGYHWQEMVNPQTGFRQIVAVPN